MKFRLYYGHSQTLHSFVGHHELSHLLESYSCRTNLGFRPKTRRSYFLFFRNIIVFCVCLKVSLINLSVEIIVVYLEYLAEHGVTLNIIANNLSAILANLIIYGFDHSFIEPPRVFLVFFEVYMYKLTLINPLSQYHVLAGFPVLSTCMGSHSLWKNIQSYFLIAFFVFLRISNVASHSTSAFDSSIHLTPCDIIISKKVIKISLKWSKTIHTRGRLHVVLVPKLHNSLLCPVTALLQNIKLGYPSNHFTFHNFRRSVATLAYNSHMLIQSIKRHDSWEGQSKGKVKYTQEGYHQSLIL